jgi:ABC-type sugar transport system substrate-binding protein
MRSFGWAALLALALLTLAVGTGHAAEPTVGVTSLLLADWWGDVRAWFSAQASNRTRVVQFGLIGMLLALAILYTAGKRRR